MEHRVSSFSSTFELIIVTRLSHLVVYIPVGQFYLVRTSFKITYLLCFKIRSENLVFLKKIEAL